MAMSTNSPSKPQKRIRKKEIVKKKSDSSSSAAAAAASATTTTTTGVIAVNGETQTLDSLPVNSCHQCRQKKASFMATCKHQRANKPCPIKFCQPCLLNRYGEKVEEVTVLDDWKCPRCRDICNCSLCMKKKGHRPTGILAHTAKTTGFSSVSEMLNVKGQEYLISEEVVNDVSTSAAALVALSQEMSGGSPVKPGKENCCHENLNVPIDPSTSEGGVKNTSKNKRKTVGNSDSNGHIVQGGKNKSVKLDNKSTNNSLTSEKSTLNPTENDAIDGGDDNFISDAKGFKKSRISKKHRQSPMKEEETIRAGDGATLVALKMEVPVDFDQMQECGDVREVPKIFGKLKMHEKVINGVENTYNDAEKVLIVSDNMKVPEIINVGDDQPQLKRIRKAWESTIGLCNSASDEDISLPQGTNLTTVAGIDLPSEDVGHALQFLEFCKAFGKVFDLRKGHPESLLRELTRDGSRRRRQYSPVIQFQVQLLSFIQKNGGERAPLSPTSNDHSWLQALEKCISQSCCKLGELPSNCFDKSGNGYDQLNPSKKLRILNFLCDEALGTGDLRTWIDEENSKLIEEEREARQRVFAAREKEKCLKKEIQDETFKRVLLKIDSPLLREIDDHVSSLKVEAAKAHTEVLQAIDMLHKKKQRPDALRTDPTILSGNGQVVWSLRSYSSGQDVLLQDIGSWDSLTSEDKWFTYAIEQKQAVENCISSLRRKRLRAPIGPNVGALEASEESIKHESSDDQSSPSEGS